MSQHPREDEYMDQHPLEDFDPDTLDGRALPTPLRAVQHAIELIGESVRDLARSVAVRAAIGQALQDVEDSICDYERRHPGP